LADVPVIVSEAGKSRGSGDPFFLSFLPQWKLKKSWSKVIIVVMLCMYIQTQSSTIPPFKPYDVTYPNSSDYEAYYDISFSLSRMEECVSLFFKE